MNWLALLKLPSRIAAVLAGVGILGGVFSPASAEAGYRKVPEKYQDVDVQVLQSGPTLLFSDSPEMVYDNGILYKDVVEGEGRVFFHHVNGTKNTRKLAILMRPVDKRATITWGCRGIGDPDKRYYISARKGQTRYFNEYKELLKKAHKNELEEKRENSKKNRINKNEIPEYSFYRKVPDLPLTTLARGEYLEVLSQARNMQHAGARLKPEQLLTGMFDFYTNHPVEIVIMMCNPEEDVDKFSREGILLPMDEHPLRGTYRNADLTYIVKKPVQMKWYQAKALCMASSDDPYYLTGIDSMTGKTTQNHGNYGVVYHLVYSVAGEHPIQLGINPWGGEFYGAGMMISDGKAVIVNIPGRNLFFGRGDEVDDVFTHLPNHKRIDAEFIWSPPGASNLPIRAFWTVNRLEDSKKS
ncbi:MAG: hypothetical protein IJ858_02175 [Acidaminococcaceae bacterium]|nr:hypothetical protein [Acidaminococcaceae bacterium]